jgi:diaminopimelate epimerase
VGETLSCGTGLCASGVVLQALTGIHQWTIAVRGGRLRVIVRDDNTVTLTGPPPSSARFSSRSSFRCPRVSWRPRGP